MKYLFKPLVEWSPARTPRRTSTVALGFGWHEGHRGDGSSPRDSPGPPSRVKLRKVVSALVMRGKSPYLIVDLLRDDLVPLLLLIAAKWSDSEGDLLWENIIHSYIINRAVLPDKEKFHGRWPSAK